MYAVNWFSASRSLNMFSALTATRVKEPMMSRQQIIIQTAAKDIKPWVKMLWKPSEMK